MPNRFILLRTLHAEPVQQAKEYNHAETVYFHTGSAYAEMVFLPNRIEMPKRPFMPKGFFMPKGLIMPDAHN